MPVEGDKFQVEAAALEWKYFAAGDDHLLDQAVWYGSSRYLRAWSFVQLQNDGAARDVSFELFTNGPADAWLNDKHVHRTEEFDYVNPNPSKFSARLNAGLNTLLMRREHVMALGGPFVLALHLTENGAGLQNVRVQIPTRTTDVARRQRLEAALQSAHLSRDNYDAGQHIALLVPQLKSGAGPVKVELRSAGKAVREAVWNTDAKPELVDLGRVEGLKAGSYSVALLAEGNRRDLSFRIYAGEFLTSPRPGSTGEERRRTLLEGIADGAGAPLDPKKPPGNLLWSNGPIRGEIAKMHLNRWDQVAPSTLLTYIAGISRREDGANFRMLDLTALIIRYGQNPKFSPVVLAEARKCVLGWKYWVDEPGQTAMNFNSENHQLACHSAEILAGQLFPDETFFNNGKSGAWHREHGEKMALAWLEKRAAYGFEEWDANGYLAADTNLLSYLSTLANNPRIKSLAHQKPGASSAGQDFPVAGFELVSRQLRLDARRTGARAHGLGIHPRFAQ